MSIFDVDALLLAEKFFKNLKKLVDKEKVS